jgi:hypothetical protein
MCRVNSIPIRPNKGKKGFSPEDFAYLQLMWVQPDVCRSIYSIVGPFSNNVGRSAFYSHLIWVENAMFAGPRDYVCRS